jgi:hypothetical protein
MMIRTSCCVAVLAMATVVLAQSEFSAEVVNNQNPSKTPTKVYFGKDKVRFETADNNERGGGAVIMDLTTQKFLVLMPKQNMYMEMPESMMESRGMFQFFKSGDAENACAEWLKLEDNKGGTCHKAGHETVNGRDTVKYEGTNASGESKTAWLDTKVRFPIKWVGKNNGGELRNIQEGPQPASLFEIHAGYSKMDMGNMMQRPK